MIKNSKKQRILIVFFALNFPQVIFIFEFRENRAKMPAAAQNGDENVGKLLSHLSSKLTLNCF